MWKETEVQTDFRKKEMSGWPEEVNENVGDGAPGVPWSSQLSRRKEGDHLRVPEYEQWRETGDKGKDICLSEREDLYYGAGKMKLGRKDSDDQRMINNQWS